MRNIIKALLSFIWLLPFAYIFSDIYFELNYKIDKQILKYLIYLSFICALILIIIWFKEFRYLSYLNKAFRYLEQAKLGSLDKILKRTHPSMYYEKGQTLLHFAVNEQLDNDTIMFLLSRGCYASFSGSRTFDLSYTLFFLCSYYNDLNLSIIKYIVEKGASVNFIDNSNGFDGLSTLHSLILKSDYESISYLLEQGADLNYYIKELAVNALMLATKYCEDTSIIKILLEYGANVNEINKHGYNALLFASHYNSNSSIISLLLNAGAVIKAYNVRSSAFTYSEVTPLMLAASYNNINIVKRLIKAGDQVSYKDNNGLSILFMAAAHNTDVEVIKTLISAGASLEDSKDVENNTPLMAASFLNPNPLVIKYLINRTHNLNSSNIEGLTFIDFLYQNDNISDKEKDSILNY